MGFGVRVSACGAQGLGFQVLGHPKTATGDSGFFWALGFLVILRKLLGRSLVFWSKTGPWHSKITPRSTSELRWWLFSGLLCQAGSSVGLNFKRWSLGSVGFWDARFKVQGLGCGGISYVDRKARLNARHT